MPELALVDKRRLARGLAQAARPQAAAPREVTSLTYADVATEGRRHDACRDGVSTGGYLDGLGARPCAPGVNKPERGGPSWATSEAAWGAVRPPFLFLQMAASS